MNTARKLSQSADEPGEYFIIVVLDNDDRLHLCTIVYK